MMGPIYVLDPIDEKAAPLVAIVLFAAVFVIEVTAFYFANFLAPTRSLWGWVGLGLAVCGVVIGIGGGVCLVTHLTSS